MEVKSVDFGEIAQDSGYYAVQSFRVTDFGTNEKRVCDFLLVIVVTYLISFTVSEIWYIWRIIGQIFAVDRVPVFNALIRD